MSEPTYTPPPITGYRTLTQAEVDLMNDIKAYGQQLEHLCNKVMNIADVDPRWAAIGRTNLQQGLMALTRSVARPTTF